MRRIFVCLLSGFLLNLLLFKNSIAENSSENIHGIEDSFKSANYLVDYAPVFMFFKQNGTGRHSNVTFSNLETTKNINSNKLDSDWITLLTTICDSYFTYNKIGYLNEAIGILLYQNNFHQHFSPINKFSPNCDASLNGVACRLYIEIVASQRIKNDMPYPLKVILKATFHSFCCG